MVLGGGGWQSPAWSWAKSLPNPLTTGLLGPLLGLPEQVRRGTVGAHPPSTEPSLVVGSQVPALVTILFVLSQADATGHT